MWLQTAIRDLYFLGTFQTCGPKGAVPHPIIQVGSSMRVNRAPHSQKQREEGQTGRG